MCGSREASTTSSRSRSKGSASQQSQSQSQGSPATGTVVAPVEGVALIFHNTETQQSEIVEGLHSELFHARVSLLSVNTITTWKVTVAAKNGDLWVGVIGRNLSTEGAFTYAFGSKNYATENFYGCNTAADWSAGSQLVFTFDPIKLELSVSQQQRINGIDQRVSSTLSLQGASAMDREFELTWSRTNESDEIYFSDFVEKDEPALPTPLKPAATTVEKSYSCGAWGLFFAWFICCLAMHGGMETIFANPNDSFMMKNPTFAPTYAPTYVPTHASTYAPVHASMYTPKNGEIIRHREVLYARRDAANRRAAAAAAGGELLEPSDITTSVAATEEVPPSNSGSDAAQQDLKSSSNALIASAQDAGVITTQQLLTNSAEGEHDIALDSSNDADAVSPTPAHLTEASSYESNSNETRVEKEAAELEFVDHNTLAEDLPTGIQQFTGTSMQVPMVSESSLVLDEAAEWSKWSNQFTACYAANSSHFGAYEWR